jgi:transposase
VITIGVDAHKRVNQGLAIDDNGVELGRCRGINDARGWADMMAWAETLGGIRQWGIEGAWSYGRGLAQQLVAMGEQVYDVNPRWTAAERRRARRLDKTDRLDARAIALFVRQEAPDLPAVASEDETAVLGLLSLEREAALAESTRLRNQLHALLLQLDPHYEQLLPSLKTKAGLAILKAYEAPDTRPMQEARAASIRRLAVRLELALQQAEQLADQIRSLAEECCEPLTRICGVNLLTAGTIAGILGPGRRFRSDAALAAYAGVAPLETSSAERVRHRLNRSGNRRLNAILYRIVLTQAHYSPQARAYLAKRMAEGRTRKEAVRGLKRYVVRAVFNAWIDCPIDTRPPALAPRATSGCT